MHNWGGYCPQNEAARNIPSNPRAIACLYYFKYGKRRYINIIMFLPPLYPHPQTELNNKNDGKNMIIKPILY